MGDIFKVWKRGEEEHFSEEGNQILTFPDDARMLEEPPEENQSYSGGKKKGPLLMSLRQLMRLMSLMQLMQVGQAEEESDTSWRICIYAAHDFNTADLILPLRRSR